VTAGAPPPLSLGGPLAGASLARPGQSRGFRSSTVAFGVKAGIVGLPNVGKSTLFNALTESKGAEAANFPFCTIEANVGIVTGESTHRASRPGRGPCPSVPALP